MVSVASCGGTPCVLTHCSATQLISCAVFARRETQHTGQMRALQRTSPVHHACAAPSLSSFWMEGCRVNLTWPHLRVRSGVSGKARSVSRADHTARRSLLVCPFEPSPPTQPKAPRRPTRRVQLRAESGQGSRGGVIALLRLRAQACQVCCTACDVTRPDATAADSGAVSARTPARTASASPRWQAVRAVRALAR